MKSILESILMVAAEPVSLQDIQETFEGEMEISSLEILAFIEELKIEYLSQMRGYQITEVAGKYQLCTDPQNAQWVKKFLQAAHAEGLSKPALETLAIIAYRQPLTKLEMEGIRGVNVDGVLKKLTDKGLIRTRGKKDIMGHPFLYVTTERFLEYFGLKSLEDLPQKQELSFKKTNGISERLEHEPEKIETENRSN
ncbi:MAG: SMC-Scp complex subunit ScpB [Chlamydiae bacterium]|nr:SMC-Scp complex subunit ScpB [Chlamydiota bacterium]